MQIFDKTLTVEEYIQRLEQQYRNALARNTRRRHAKKKSLGLKTGTMLEKETPSWKDNGRTDLGNAAS